MFIWGKGHNTIKVPINNAPPCVTCNEIGHLVVRINYDYDHILWLFKGIKNKVVSVGCERCASELIVDKETETELFAAMPKNPIPFMDRYGALVLIAIIVAWVSFALAFPCLVNPGSQTCSQSQLP
jgi:hypothetical protein